MATYESIILGLEEVSEGIDRLKVTNAQLLEALELSLSAFDNILRSAGSSPAGFIASRRLMARAQKQATAAIKAATES